MIALMIMTMSAAFSYNLGTGDLRMVKNIDYGTAAHNLAEAGLAEAVSVLKANFNDWSNAAKFPATNLGAGTYDATVTKNGTRYLVSSVGTVQNQQRTVTAEVTPPTVSALAYILAGGSTLDLRLTAKSTLDIKGDVYAASTIEMKAIANQASINFHDAGNVYSGGAINNGGGTITYGSLTPNWTTQVGFPVFDFSKYQAIAAANNYAYISADPANPTTFTYATANSLPPAPAGGVLYFDGNVTISAQQTTNACIIATGTITITQGTVTVNQYLNYPAMMTQKGDIILRSVGNSAKGSLVATGLVYAANNFSLSGNHNSATVTGSILARGTLEESGTQDSLTMIYQAQNPPFMTTTGGATFNVRSYNS